MIRECILLYPATTLHGVTTLKNITATKASKLFHLVPQNNKSML